MTSVFGGWGDLDCEHPSADGGVTFLKGDLVCASLPFFLFKNASLPLSDNNESSETSANLGFQNKDWVQTVQTSQWHRFHQKPLHKDDNGGTGPHTIFGILQ
ncbi:hypothetical protein O181_080997 [Austropuccinia psidii MF-1]|uniref:Uncharacterized protein n=1 Tax=Austropuccinia psidii MF-1 TaxID=1389203 RepID=A0A9Q3FMP6_9BASI|nr:hypothetical protein [Austropuccinia psidii MF-1]